MRLNSSFGDKTPKTATGVNKATLQLDTSPHICHFKAHYVTPWRYHSFILLFFHFSIYPFVHQAFSEYSGSVQGRWEGGKRERSLLSVPVLKLKSTERTTGFTYLNICYRTYNSFQDGVCLHLTFEETACDEIFFKVQWGHVSVSYCYITNHPKTWWLKTINIYYGSQVSESAMCFIWSWLDSFMCLQSHVGSVTVLILTWVG